MKHKKFKIFKLDIARDIITSMLGGKVSGRNNEIEEFLQGNDVLPKSISVLQKNVGGDILIIGYEEMIEGEWKKHHYKLIFKEIDCCNVVESLEKEASELSGVVCQDIFFEEVIIDKCELYVLFLIATEKG